MMNKAYGPPPKKEVRFEDIKVSMEPHHSNSSESSVDCDRMEALWTDKSNQLLKKWKFELNEDRAVHDKKAERNKQLFNFMSIPTIILPLSASILQPYIPDPFIISILMLISGLFSCLVTFFDFSSKRSKHAIASNSYSEISINIEEVLATSKRFRTPVDITVRSILLKINAVKSKAPQI